MTTPTITGRPRLVLGIALAVVYLSMIPLANYAITHWGTQFEPGGPHLIHLWPFDLWAPSGVLFIGFAFVARDMVQRVLGKIVALVAIIVGILVTATFAEPALVAASAVAFGISEVADFSVYTPLVKRSLWIAVILSGIVGSVLDSMIFLSMAFGSINHWQGQVVGKVMMNVLALPLVWLLRRVVPDKESADLSNVPVSVA